jgi:hypothetical protein
MERVLLELDLARGRRLPELPQQGPLKICINDVNGASTVSTVGVTKTLLEKSDRADHPSRAKTFLSRGRQGTIAQRIT